jgi:anti-sigma B factor antagonist
VLTIERPAPTVVRLVGELDIVGAEELRSALQTAQLAEEIELDLGGLEFLDSTGLASLIDLALEVHQQGGRLRTTSPPGSEARVVIGLSGLAPQLGMDDV